MRSRELEESLSNSELARHPDLLAVVTATFYPGWYSGDTANQGDTQELHNIKIRGDLALKTLTKARNLGHYVLVVDDTGENSAFRSALSDLDIKVESQVDKGMDPARQQAFSRAAEQDSVKVITWVEPEKESMVDRECLWPAALAVLNKTYDLVIPARDEAGFATYPDYQVNYEKRANTRFNEILRIAELLKPNDPDLDAWFGPRVFNKELLPYFTGKYDFRQDAESEAIKELYKHIKPGNYNSATFFPIIRALYEKKKVGSITIPYRHPKIQTESETNDPAMEDKRHGQYMNIIVASIHYIHHLLNQKSRISAH